MNRHDGDESTVTASCGQYVSGPCQMADVASALRQLVSDNSLLLVKVEWLHLFL